LRSKAPKMRAVDEPSTKLQKAKCLEFKKIRSSFKKALSDAPYACIFAPSFFHLASHEVGSWSAPIWKGIVTNFGETRTRTPSTRNIGETIVVSGFMETTGMDRGWKSCISPGVRRRARGLSQCGTRYSVRGAG
jgi:hypothetical protein